MNVGVGILLFSRKKKKNKRPEKSKVSYQNEMGPVIRSSQ